ncbi:putative NADP-dependent oxidoreductase domain-containing protein [Helianthus annuus]|nr:putative NADP-dependent oxidoreductase domain-containing protein [Helianthus annuus]
MASIEKLQVEYLDLAYCTEPKSPKSIEEVVRAMKFRIEDGLIHYWGTSYWCANNIKIAQQIAEDRGLIGPMAAHSRYNILFTSQVTEFIECV